MDLCLQWNLFDCTLIMVLADCLQECCPLDKFVEVTKDRVPVDWMAECKNTHGSPGSGVSFGELHLHGYHHSVLGIVSCEWVWWFLWWVTHLHDRHHSVLQMWIVNHDWVRWFLWWVSPPWMLSLSYKCRQWIVTVCGDSFGDFHLQCWSSLAYKHG